MIELHAIVRGRVQLVMFRDFTQRHARRLGISGFVKNLSDGTVEVVGQGEKEKLEQLLRDLHGGPLLSRVDTVQSELRTPTDKFDDFTIAYEH